MSGARTLSFSRVIFPPHSLTLPHPYEFRAVPHTRLHRPGSAALPNRPPRGSVPYSAPYPACLNWGSAPSHPVACHSQPPAARVAHRLAPLPSPARSVCMTFSYPCLPGGTVPAGSAVCCVPKGWEKTELGEVGVLGRCSKGRAGNDVILLCIWLTGLAWIWRETPGKPDGTCPECSYSTTILARTFCVPPPRPTYSCVNDALLSRTFNMKCKVQQSNG